LGTSGLQSCPPKNDLSKAPITNIYKFANTFSWGLKFDKLAHPDNYFAKLAQITLFIFLQTYF
jgi:hypothetical protein